MVARVPFTLLFSALVVCFATAPAGAADPFYARLLAEGTQQLDSDPAEAARLLRTAAFGLLEEPDQLALALVRLGIAQSRSRDGDGFRETFDRLLQIEQRFEVYGSADLSDREREAFEKAIPIHVSEEVLRAAPLFSDLAQRRLELKLSRLPVREQRRELEALVSARPEDPGRLMAIAHFENRQDRPKRALDWLDRLLRTRPDHPGANCLRGEIAATRNDCGRAVEALASCPQAPTEAGAAAARLRCWVRLERWAEAAALVDGLAPPLADDPEIARLAARVERPPSAPEPADDVAATPPRAPTGETEAPEGAEETAGLAAELTRVRALIAAAVSADELETALDQAVELADAHRDSDEAQIVAAEAAYRASRWETAARLFDRSPPPPGERPLLVFYQSISLYETGRPEEAATALRAVLPRLARTDFVQAYIERILGPGGSG